MHIKELTIEECYNNLAGQRTGRLACARNNQPYVVPFHFAYDGKDSIYAFSTYGQKIEWMRENPLVCIEVDNIKDQTDWMSLIIFGRYQELAESAEYEGERKRAYELLSKSAMWWEPAYVAGVHQAPWNPKPIYFRVTIESITGHCAIADDLNSEQENNKTNQPENRGWLATFWKTGLTG
jgi:uncharacterized protein